MKLLALLVCIVIGGTSCSRLKRMVGGDDVEIIEVPYQVSIRVNDYHVCGGALIGKRHVLTAAHCVSDLFTEPYDELTVVTGSASLKSGGETHNVVDIDWHKEFINGLESYWVNDIAIITLKKDVKENKNQKIVALPTKRTPANVIGIVSGFGRTATESSYPSTTLKVAKTTILLSTKCREIVTKHKILDTQICGIQRKGVGICKGDSGGPLVYDGTIVGIASWNQPCALGIPDVYTSVYDFMDFIKVTSGLSGSSASKLRNGSRDILDIAFLILVSVVQPLFFNYVLHVCVV